MAQNAFNLMTTTTVVSLSTTALAGLSSTQFSAFSPAQAQLLTTTQVSSLSTTQLGSLNVDAIVSLSSTQAAALTTTTQVALVVGPMTTLQKPTFPIDGGTPTAITTAAIASTQINSLNPAVMSRLVPPATYKTEVSAVGATPGGTFTATVLYLLKYDGVTMSPITQAVSGAATVSSTAAAPVYPILDQQGQALTEANPIRLAPGESLWVASSVALAIGWNWSAKIKRYT